MYHTDRRWATLAQATTSTSPTAADRSPSAGRTDATTRSCRPTVVTRMFEKAEARVTASASTAASTSARTRVSDAAGLERPRGRKLQHVGVTMRR